MHVRITRRLNPFSICTYNPRIRLSYPLLTDRDMIYPVQIMCRHLSSGTCPIGFAPVSPCLRAKRYFSSFRTHIHTSFGAIIHICTGIHTYTVYTFNAIAILRVSSIEGLIVCVYTSSKLRDIWSSESLSYSAAVFSPRTFLVRSLRVNLCF